MITLPNRKALPALLALVALTMSVAACKDFFTDPKLTSIAVNPSTASVGVGNTTPLLATGTYDDNTTKDVTGSVNWTVTASSPSGAATVGNTSGTKGVVTGVLTGTATVQASASGATSGSASINVGLTVASIVVTPANSTVSLLATPTVQYKAEATLSDGTTMQDVTNSVTWTSSSTTDATFDTTNHGLATLHASDASPVTITATYTQTSGNVTGQTQLTINP